MFFNPQKIEKYTIYHPYTTYGGAILLYNSLGIAMHKTLFWVDFSFLCLVLHWNSIVKLTYVETDRKG